MDDVAERARVSRSLVSLVMRDSPKVSAKRRAAVLQAAKELGYRPNVLARNLASSKTMTIGVTIDDMHNPFFADVVDGIQATAADHGYQTLLTTDGLAGDSAAGAETLLRLRVDALVLAGTRLRAKAIAEIAKTTPTVLVGRVSRSRGVDMVNNDELVGAKLAVDRLVELGHSRIAHISGGAGAGARSRSTGYERAMRAHGLTDLIQVASGEFTEQSGRDQAAVLLGSSNPPTAIFAANDMVAAGVLGVVDQTDQRTPEDISLIGYDNSAIASMRRLSLTTVAQPLEEMGTRAIELLLERIDGRTDDVRHVVKPRLLERSTTAPPPRRG